MLTRRFYKFEGRVQGVGFRFTLYHRAIELGLTGWVKNCYDGSVEATIQGEDVYIDDLIRYMNNSPYIVIRNIHKKELKPILEEKSFEIKFF